MSILQLLASENYITVNKTMIKELGLEEAVIFGELCSEYCFWERENKLVDGMFYCSADKLEDITGLSEYKQRRAINNLIKAGYLIQVLKGLPATRYFKIIQDQVLKLFQVSSENFKELDPENFQLSNKNIDKKKKSKKSNSKELLQSFEFGPSNKAPKQSLYSKCVADINSRNYPKDLHSALIDYLQVRLQIKDKPLYANSWKGLLNKLERDFDNDKERLQAVYQSIERGYTSFFPANKGFINTNKPWEDGTVSNAMTQEEREAEEREADRLEALGIKARF